MDSLWEDAARLIRGRILQVEIVEFRPLARGHLETQGFFIVLGEVEVNGARTDADSGDHKGPLHRSIQQRGMHGPDRVQPGLAGQRCKGVGERPVAAGHNLITAIKP